MSRVIANDDDADNVATAESTARRAFWLREGIILAGFILLVVVGVFTVALPELRKEPEGQGAAESAGVGAPVEGNPASAPATPQAP